MSTRATGEYNAGPGARLSFLLLLIGACAGPGTDEAEPEPEATPAPRIRVEPLELNFREVGLGGSSEAGAVTVTNDGDATLTLEAVSLAEAEPAFTLAPLGSSVLEPGASTTFTVTFLPDVSGGFLTDALVRSDDPATPEVAVSLAGVGTAGEIRVEPMAHDFGAVTRGDSDEVVLTIWNDGVSDLTVSDVTYATPGSELTLDTVQAINGPFPWILPPRTNREVRVFYAPTDDAPDEGYVTVYSDDPDEPEVNANQTGTARAWDGFTRGWSIFDDPANYEANSDATYPVEAEGDRDAFWYEPSGAHGMIDSADVARDFGILHEYVLARAAAVTPLTGPIDVHSVSTVPSFDYASYSYLACDFWLDADEDPARYALQSGAANDSILVFLNGELLGDAVLSSGSWPLTNAVPAAVNSLVVILMANTSGDKSLEDLAFYRDGAIVTEP